MTKGNLLLNESLEIDKKEEAEKKAKKKGPQKDLKAYIRNYNEKRNVAMGNSLNEDEEDEQLIDKRLVIKNRRIREQVRKLINSKSRVTINPNFFEERIGELVKGQKKQKRKSSVEPSLESLQENSEEKKELYSNRGYPEIEIYNEDTLRSMSQPRKLTQSIMGKSD
mmetsp:Transcript_17243/g.16449  ORF Transcript_17243/g.16449 Transcript_17243/m.16449 type:complete len:167 (-) Transcript_17243:691-1191(-)